MIWVGRLNLYLKFHLNMNLNPLLSVDLSQRWNGVGKLVQQCLLRCGFPGQGGIALSLLLAQTCLRCGCLIVQHPLLFQTGLRLGFAFCSELSRSSQECLEVVDFSHLLSLPKSQTTFTSKDYRKKHFWQETSNHEKIYSRKILSVLL